MFFRKKGILIQDFISNSFVDIHSHLLPEIDDGAKNMETTIQLIQDLSEFGIKNFITTPHVLGDVYPNSSKTITEKLLLVKEELSKNNINDISISAAAEYMLDEQFQERLKNNDILTLKKNFILVELLYFNPPLNLFDILFDIQLKGYKPVLAHPERYNFYHNEFETYQKLKNAGCLFQLNLLSLSKHYGENVRKIAHKLLDNNMYDLVGTDTHHKKHIELLKTIKISKQSEKLKALFHRNEQFYN